MMDLSSHSLIDGCGTTRAYRRRDLSLTAQAV